jgi:hypothetical protein
MAPFTFYVLCGVYLICYGYAFHSSVAQVFINITFGITKYVQKKILLHALQKGVDTKAAIVGNLFMDLSQNLFTSFAIAHNASFLAVISNLLVEVLLQCRMFWACFESYQNLRKRALRCFQSVHWWRCLGGDIDQLGNKIDENKLTRRRQTQADMILTGSISHILAGVAFTFLFFVTKDKPTYPFSTAVMLRSFQADPVLSHWSGQDDTMLVVFLIWVTHLSTFLFGMVFLFLLKVAFRHKGVFLAMRIFRDHHLLCTSALITPIIFPVTLINYNTRYYSFFFPDAYG